MHLLSPHRQLFSRHRRNYLSLQSLLATHLLNLGEGKMILLLGQDTVMQDYCCALPTHVGVQAFHLLIL